MHPLDRKILNADENLPRYYGKDTLVLMPRDPYWLFAYWEISEPTRERIRNEWGEGDLAAAEPVLRVYRYLWGKEEIESSYDIPLPDGTDSWHLQVGVADRLYHVELGWKRHGQFFAVLRSNIVRTPRDAVSDIIDENWQLPDWQARKLFRRINLAHLSSPELHRRQRRSLLRSRKGGQHG
jgi:hypothetical protein